jgi:hypothetical protein
MKKTIKVSLDDMGMPRIPKNIIKGNEVMVNMTNIKTSENHVDNMNIILDEN